MKDETTRVLAAYRRGATADMLQARMDDGEWGVIWTIPPCSPANAEEAARQLIRMRATEIKHTRRAHLLSRTGTREDIIVVTVLPERCQEVRSLGSGEVLTLPLLEDDVLATLSRTFIPHTPRAIQAESGGG